MSSSYPSPQYYPPVPAQPQPPVQYYGGAQAQPVQYYAQPTFPQYGQPQYGQQYNQYGMPCGNLPAVAGPTSEEMSGASMAHWLGIFVGWLAPVIVLVSNDGRSAFVRRHAMAAINFHVSMLIWVMIAAFASMLLVGIPFLIGLAVYEIVGAIQGGMAASRGEEFQYKLTINFFS